MNPGFVCDHQDENDAIDINFFVPWEKVSDFDKEQYAKCLDFLLRDLINPGLMCNKKNVL